jgi:hypothetical protein
MKTLGRLVRYGPAGAGAGKTGCAPWFERPISIDWRYGVVSGSESSSAGAPFWMIMSVPCSGLQPPEFDINRYFWVLLWTSSTARSCGHGCVTACSTMIGATFCVGPPRGVTWIDEGYGDPAP